MSTLDLTRFAHPREFRQRAEPYLLQHEAEHSLPLGLLPALELNPLRYGGGAPYFALVSRDGDVVAAAVMTPPHRLVLARTQDNDALRLIARDTLGFRPDLPGVMGPAEEGKSFARAWQDLTGGTYAINRRERLYRLDAVTAPGLVSGRLRQATAQDRDLLVEWLDAFQKEALEVDSIEEARRTAAGMLELPDSVRSVFFWEDEGQPVSMAGYSRPTARGMSVNPVYTPPQFRNRGYASACTAAVSQHLLDSGRAFCVLFTDLANPTSNAIYQRIGYHPVCDFDEYDFTKR